MATVRIAFYKAPGKLLDKCVRVRTGSIYSHCELIVNEYSYSSSIRDGGVRRKAIIYNPESWDIFELVDSIDSEQIVALFDRTKGYKYDYVGVLLGQLLNTYWHVKGKYFCSEWGANGVGFDNPNQYSPQRLLDKLKELNLLK